MIKFKQFYWCFLFCQLIFQPVYHRCLRLRRMHHLFCDLSGNRSYLIFFFPLLQTGIRDLLFFCSTYRFRLLQYCIRFRNPRTRVRRFLPYACCSKPAMAITSIHRWSSPVISDASIRRSGRSFLPAKICLCSIHICPVKIFRQPAPDFCNLCFFSQHAYHTRIHPQPVVPDPDIL